MINDFKLYKNKHIGKFLSIPAKSVGSPLDSLYLSTNFHKLRAKPLAAIRESKHYSSTLASWEEKLKLNRVDTTDIAAVAKTLGFNVEVFNPLASSQQQTLFSGGGRSSKRVAQLLKVKKGTYKPMKAGAIIDELPPDMMRDRIGGADNPLTWDNWTVTLPGATDIALTDQKASEIVGDSINLTNIFADNARRGIERGIENFFKNAQWFEVETDLKIIAKRLGHSESFLQSFRRQRQCYQQSYLFSIADKRCYTIHGWATDIKLQFPTAHACLCAVLDDGLFVFDLVRDVPLLMFGAPVRRDFMERIEDIGSHGGLYAIDTMNFLNQQSRWNNNQDDLETLLDVLRAKRLSEKKQEEQDELSEEDYSDSSDAEDEENETNLFENESEEDDTRNVRRRVGSYNIQTRRSNYIGGNSINDNTLTNTIQILFRKMSSLDMKQGLINKLKQNCVN